MILRFLERGFCGPINRILHILFVGSYGREDYSATQPLVQYQFQFQFQFQFFFLTRSKKMWAFYSVRDMLYYVSDIHWVFSTSTEPYFEY